MWAHEKVSHESVKHCLIILIILITLWLNPIWQTLVELHHIILFALGKVWPYSADKVWIKCVFLLTDIMTSYLYFWKISWQAMISQLTSLWWSKFCSDTVHTLFSRSTPSLLHRFVVLSCVNSLPSVSDYNWLLGSAWLSLLSPVIGAGDIKGSSLPPSAQMLESKYFLYSEEGNSKQTNEVRFDTVCVGRPAP